MSGSNDARSLHWIGITGTAHRVVRTLCPVGVILLLVTLTARRYWSTLTVTHITRTRGQRKSSSTMQRIRLTLRPQAAQAQPGEQLSFLLTIENSGSLAHDVAIRVIGLQRKAYTLNKPTVSIPPGDATRVHLWVKPPTDAAIGRYPFRVELTAEDDLAVRASATAELVVAKYTTRNLAWSVERDSPEKSRQTFGHVLRYVAPAVRFCMGSNALVTPYVAAVASISCMSPLAPAGEMACGSPPDSALMTAEMRVGDTPVAAATLLTRRGMSGV